MLCGVAQPSLVARGHSYFNQTYYKTSGLTSATITTNGNNICQIMAKQLLAITSAKQLKQICPNKMKDTPSL